MCHERESIICVSYVIQMCHDTTLGNIMCHERESIICVSYVIQMCHDTTLGYLCVLNKYLLAAAATNSEGRFEYSIYIYYNNS